MDEFFDLYFPKSPVKQCCHEYLEDEMLYCQKFGHREPIIVEKKYNYLERPIVMPVPYKRISHFKERLNQLQALKNISITPDILGLCKDCKDHEEVKSLLQKHKQIRFYEHVYSILKH